MLQKGISRLKTNKQFANLVIYGTGQGFNLVTPLLVIPYIIAVCGLENYGKAAFGMALTFFLIVFIDYGSDIIGVKEVATNRDDKDRLQTIFSTTYVSKFLVLVALLITASIVFSMVPYFRKDKWLFFLGLPILVGQFLNPTWFLQGVENFKQITILNILSKVIYLVGVFGFIRQSDDYIYINMIWGIGMVVANGISFLQIQKTYRFHFTGVTQQQVRAQLQNNFSMFFSQVFVSIQLYAPLLLIGFLGNPTMAGIYRVVDQVVVIFKTYLLLFFNFAFPRVCYLLETNLKAGFRFWKIYNGANFAFIAFAMAVLYVLADQVVAYFHPGAIPEIRELLQLAILLPLMMAVSLPLKQLLLGFNQQKFYINATMVLVIFNILLIIISIPIFGNFGVLAALIIIEVITAMLFFLKIKNRLFQQ